MTFTIKMLVVFMTTWSNGHVEVADEVFSKTYKGAQEACQVVGENWLKKRLREKEDHRSYSYRCDLEIKRVN